LIHSYVDCVSVVREGLNVDSTVEQQPDELQSVLDYETNCTITVLHITNNLTET